MKIGITGGIGSGKSYVCRLLTKRGIEVYDCDSAAKRLMRTSATLRQQLTAIIGPQAYLKEEANGMPEHDKSPSQAESWKLNKAAVAQFLLASEENAHAVDAIVHPAVFQDFEQSGMLWMESAILFESGINRLVDYVVIVTAPTELRIRRIMNRDGISHDKAKEWIARQWPQEEVRLRANFEIINDGHSDLEQQIDRLLKRIQDQDSVRDSFNETTLIQRDYSQEKS